MNYRPLTAAALGFCAGILFGEYLKGIWAACALCLFVLLWAFCLLRRRYPPLLVCLSLLCGMLRLRLVAVMDIEPLRQAAAPVLRLLEALRDRLLGYSDALFYDCAPILRAMLWGDKTQLPAGEYAAFRVAGVAHTLALSGLHVSFLAGALLLALPRRKPRLRFWSTAAFLLLYCAVTAFSPSLVRASIMTLCVLGAQLFSRRNDLLSSLSLSALIILLWSPRAIFEPGFQLSFAAVAGIAMLRGPLARLMARLPHVLRESLAVTAGASLGTAPISAFRFGALPTYTLLSNFFLLPMLPFSIVPGFIAVLLYPLSPGLARVPAFVAYHSMAVVRGLSITIAGLPYSSVPLEQRPSLLACALFYVLMLLCSDYVLRDWRWKRLLLLCLCPLFLAALLLPASVV